MYCQLKALRATVLQQNMLSMLSGKKHVERCSIPWNIDIPFKYVALLSIFLSNICRGETCNISSAVVSFASTFHDMCICPSERFASHVFWVGDISIFRIRAYDIWYIISNPNRLSKNKLVFFFIDASDFCPDFLGFGESTALFLFLSRWVFVAILLACVISICILFWDILCDTDELSIIVQCHCHLIFSFMYCFTTRFWNYGCPWLSNACSKNPLMYLQLL